jgi:Flp pilus assembly protein TadD
MALPIRRGCLHALLLVLALALVGCGGVPEGPLLPPASTEPPVPEDAQARAVSLTRIADTALRSGEIETAVGLFEQATLTDGRNVTAALGLGDALLAAGRDLDASRAFERALAIQPNLPAASYGYARSLIAIQRPEVAVEHLRRLVTQNPTSVEALNALGVAQDLLGDHAAATATYRRALGVVPASTSVRNNLALSLALQEQFADAVDLLRPLAEGPDATRRARQNLALVYGLQGDMSAAERISRVDLGGRDLANNLAYFAAVRGIEEPSVRAAALAPEQTLSTHEPRLTRKSKAVRRAAAPAAPNAPPVAPPQVVPPPAEPQPPPAGPRPLAPILGNADSGSPGGGTWFVDVGSFEGVAAAEQWRSLRAKHVGALSGVGRLASAGNGMEPLLVGPLASERAATSLCDQLGTDAHVCRPMQL